MGSMTPVDTSFLATAPFRLTLEAVLPATPDRVFALMGPDPSTWTWVPALDEKGHWTTEPPVGVGSVREMFVKGRPALETVIAYDADERFAFRMDTGPMPGFMKALAEDYVLEAVRGGTKLTWTMAIDLPGFLRPLMRLPMKRTFGTMQARLTEQLARQTT